MNKREQQTEDKIVAAAKQIFIEKGMAGARMQEIADKAEINKSLLHYYFRSKEKLFAHVFNYLIQDISQMFSSITKESLSIKQKIEEFVNVYIDLLIENPFLPNFIFNEIHRNTTKLSNVFKQAKLDPEKLLNPLSQQLKKEGYDIEPIDFLINTLSLTIFPFIAKPLLKLKFFNDDTEAMNNYLLERKRKLVTYILNALEGYK